MTPGQIMTFWSLGGIVAFVVLSLLPWVSEGTLVFFRDFSALIVAFLSGTLWLPAVRNAQQREARAMMLAMGLFCLAWISLFLPTWLGVMLLMLAYPLLWWPERHWFGADQSTDYRNLRTLLTWGVVATHLLALAALTMTP